MAKEIEVRIIKSISIDAITLEAYLKKLPLYDKEGYRDIFDKLPQGEELTPQNIDEVPTIEGNFCKLLWLIAEQMSNGSDEKIEIKVLS